MSKVPRKKDFIQRAHSNPFADQNIFIPVSPSSIDWSKYYSKNEPPTILDLGCGYGKYLHFLSTQFSSKNIIGIEIRKKVSEYASLKCKELTNVSVICTNGMIFIQNFFQPSSLEKIFILFPDPHFKTRKHKARMVCKQMLDIFYYLLVEDGVIYISSDVTELFEAMKGCFEDHNGFIKSNDEIIEKSIEMGTDEAMRAGIKSGQVFVSCYRKINY